MHGLKTSYTYSLRASPTLCKHTEKILNSFYTCWVSLAGCT